MSLKCALLFNYVVFLKAITNALVERKTRHAPNVFEADASFSAKQAMSCWRHCDCSCQPIDAACPRARDPILSL